MRATRNGVRIRTTGLVVCRQRPETARGILFLLLEDETGLTNVVVKPDLYEAARSIVRGAPYLVVEGIVQLRSGTLNLLAERVEPLAIDPDTGVPDAILPDAVRAIQIDSLTSLDALETPPDAPSGAPPRESPTPEAPPRERPEPARAAAARVAVELRSIAPSSRNFH